MFGRLFILFAILPILEIMLLINVSDNIGGWNTFALVLVTAFLGAYFVRREGSATLRDVQLKMANGEMPGKELSEGLLLLVAGVLLVTPGFITDVVGLLFTLPYTRAPIAASIVKSFMKSGKVEGSFTFYQQGSAGTGPFRRQQRNDDESIFEAEYVDKTASANDHLEELTQGPTEDDKRDVNKKPKEDRSQHDANKKNLKK